jgi:hypothetical protein
MSGPVSTSSFDLLVSRPFATLDQISSRTQGYHMSVVREVADIGI